MATEATIGSVRDDTTALHSLIRHAGRVVGVAAVIGVIGQMLFFDVGAGINVPIAVAIVLVGGWLLRDRSTPLALSDAWLGPTAIAYAAFVAVRADPVIATLDTLTSVALTGAALASFGGRRVVSRAFGSIVALAVKTIGWILTGAGAAIGGARRELPSSRRVIGAASPAMAILRGIALAVPVVLLFVALFASADAVFAELLDDLFGWELNLDQAIGRLVLGAAFGWLVGGGLALAASRPPEVTSTVATERWRPGTTEIMTVLASVTALFLVFVALQAAYLFGGIDTLEATGLTYAEYARRGFFELVAVAMLAGGLVIGAERLARDRTRALVGIAIVLTALTAVVLLSALLRLRLYQEAYGWTELRLYVLATIVLLAIGVVGLVVTLLADRVRWIGHVLVIAALAIGLVLNVVGPARFITEQNVARTLDPSLVPPDGSSGLDVWYASSLGDDAVPALLHAIPALGDGETDEVRRQLDFRLDRLTRDEGLTAWQAWNAGRSAARDALEAARAAGDLP
jgi:hypothetical protein